LPRRGDGDEGGGGEGGSGDGGGGDGGGGDSDGAVLREPRSNNFKFRGEVK